jgi:hypothetical protein
MESHKEVISRLKFICKLQKGEKINVKFMYVQQEGMQTQFARMFFQDNRNKTLSFVLDTINKAFELILYFERSDKISERIMCGNLIDDLKKSKIGLANLKETYNTDVKFCCDIDTLIQMIDAKLTETENEQKENISIVIPPPPFKS